MKSDPVERLWEKALQADLEVKVFSPPFKLVMYWVKRDHCNVTLTEARCVYSFDHLLHLLQSCVVHLQRLQQKKTMKQR